MQLFDYEIDLTAPSLTLLGPTPRSVTLPDGLFPGAADLNIKRITVLASAGRAVLRLPGDIEATVELAAGRDARELLAGRTVVYLDQNHWSTLSAWQNGSTRVSAENAAAASRLVEMVRTGRIVLPVSGAHLVETTPLYGERRVALARTVLSLSDGWQMRNPINVRIEELKLALEGRPPEAKDVFAPNADEVFATRRSRSDFSRLPPPFAELTAELVSALALYEAVIDPEAIPDDGGEAAAAAWAADWERVAGLLRDDGLSPERVGQVAHARLIVDVSPELAQVGRQLGLGPSELTTALLDQRDPIGSMPFLSRARGVLARRMRNSTQRWEPNHLIDIQFLACAAGYADLAIGERQTIDYLQKVDDAPTGAALAKTLPEGVALLDQR